MYKRKE